MRKLTKRIGNKKSHVNGNKTNEHEIPAGEYVRGQKIVNRCSNTNNVTAFQQLLPYFFVSEKKMRP